MRVSNLIKNAQNTIVRPGQSFHFRSSQINFFKKSGTQFVSNRCFHKIFGFYAVQ